MFVKFIIPRIKTVILLFSLCVTQTLRGQNSGAQPPLMGWASWNNFGQNISEAIIKGQADAMATSGLVDVGYKYINTDDGYFNQRSSDGTLRSDASKFPNGMKALADYIHSKGLKAGIYSDGGASTCGGLYDGQAGGINAGMYQHDQQDADLFFKTWGFDFIKVDYCGGTVLHLDEKTRYTAIKNAILNTGKPGINFNVCRWIFPGTWVTTVADSWRIAADIRANWGSITSTIDQNTFLAPYCSKGHYNDMDMLEVGRGMSFDEDKSHFSMWCILSSPLILGNDLTKLSQQTKTILTNSEVIAVNQDTTGLQAHLIKDNNAGFQVWAKNIHGRRSLERAVVLLNRTASSAMIEVKWKDLYLEGPASVRDLWAHSDLEAKDSMFSAMVPSHGVVMLKVTGTKALLQETFEAEYAWINNFNLLLNNQNVANQGRAEKDPSCSGGAKATYIGNRADNYLEFQDVYANQSGWYNMTITFECGENRNVTLSINGKDTLLTNLNSGGFSTLKSKKISVQLKQGYNKIRFSNPSGWAPDLDNIHLNLNNGNTVTAVNQKSDLNTLVSVKPNPFTSSFEIASDLPFQKAEIYSLAGKLVGSFYQSFIPTDNLLSGVYLLKVTSEHSEEFFRIVKE